MFDLLAGYSGRSFRRVKELFQPYRMLLLFTQNVAGTPGAGVVIPERDQLVVVPNRI